MAVQREWLEKDYYKVLGVQKNAPDKDVARAYRKLAKQYHPDANPGSEERFKEVSAAYEVIGDQAKRKEYDEVRTMSQHGFAGNPFAGGPGTAQGGGAGFSNFRVDDLGDLLGNIFGRGGRRGRSDAAAAGAQRGQDIEAELHLSFADAVKGATTTVNVTSEVPCSTCGGSGAAPGSARRPCARSAGAGASSTRTRACSLSAIRAWRAAGQV